MLASKILCYHIALASTRLTSHCQNDQSEGKTRHMATSEISIWQARASRACARLTPIPLNKMRLSG